MISQTRPQKGSQTAEPHRDASASGGEVTVHTLTGFVIRCELRPEVARYQSDGSLVYSFAVLSPDGEAMARSVEISSSVQDAARREVGPHFLDDSRLWYMIALDALACELDLPATLRDGDLLTVSHLTLSQLGLARGWR